MARAMRERRRGRPSAAASLARRIALFALVLFAVNAAAHRFGLIETVAFLWLLGIVFSLAVSSLVLGAIGFRRFWEDGRAGAGSSILAMLVAAGLIAPFLAAGYLALRHPRVHDVATDADDPPRFARAVGGPVSEPAPAEPAGRRYEAPPALVAEAIETVAGAQGWRRVAGSAQGGAGAEFSLEYDAPFSLHGLAGDAVLRVSDEGETVWVDMRFSTRLVAHDLGAGARRIAAFMAALDAEVAVRAQAGLFLPPGSDEEEDALD